MRVPLEKKILISAAASILFITGIAIFGFHYFSSRFSEQLMDNKIGQALASGRQIAENLIEDERRIFSENARAFSQRPEFTDFIIRLQGQKLTSDQFQAFIGLPLFTQLRIDGVFLYDEKGRCLFRHLSILDKRLSSVFPDSLKTDERFARSTSAYDSINRSLVYKTTLALPSQQQGYLITARMVEKEFAKKYERIVAANNQYTLLLRDADNMRFTHLWIFIAAVLVPAFIFILLLWFFIGQMFKPFQALSRQASNIAKGQMDYSLQLDTRDEFGALAAALNQMVQNLREEQQRILQLEKTATWREMAQRMAHEIKNPLTPIQLTIQQIKDSYSGNDEKYRKLLTECTTIIEEEIETLRNLTKEFSDFARMPIVVLKPSSLNKLIEDIILMYAAIPFEKKLDDRLPFIPLDTEAFKRVLINLIDNALAAVSNKQDRLIRIATIDVNTHVQLIIADNGYGIPKSNLERIFEPHFSTKTTSMGLGLAIIKKIIEEHQGTISVDSIENLGTTFTITLPKENPS